LLLEKLSEINHTDNKEQ